MKPLAKHFTWKEALYLPQYKREAVDSDGVTEEVKKNLETLFSKMDIIREHFKAPIKVHVAFRSPEYNVLVKGAKSSAHLEGKAVDFSIKGISCDDARNIIIKDGLLESLGLRMEDLPGSGWIHLDTRSPSPGRPRFFKP